MVSISNQQYLFRAQALPLHVPKRLLSALIAGCFLPASMAYTNDLKLSPALGQIKTPRQLFAVGHITQEVPTKLSLSKSLQLKSRPAPSGQIQLEAQQITARNGLDIVATGKARLDRDATTVFAEKLSYEQLTDIIRADQKVVLDNGRARISGDKLKLRIYDQTGEMSAPIYEIQPTLVTRPEVRMAGGQMLVSRGRADELVFAGKNQYRMNNGTWSTCSAEDPDWYLKSRDLAIDYDSQTGVAKGTSLVFKGVPIMYAPVFPFSLSSERKSGALSPSFGFSNVSGLDLSLPWYWNIAPNYDATFTPRLISRRGLQLGTEVRYLGDKQSLQTQLEWLPNDRLSNVSSRMGGSVLYQNQLTSRWTFNTNVNAVSDDNYFKDLSTRLQLTSQTSLLQQASLNYDSQDWWSFNVQGQVYQTLTGVEPYKILPKVSFTGNRKSLFNSDFDLRSTATRFTSDNATMAAGSRFVIKPSWAWSFDRDALLVVPKVSVHASYYDMDRPVSPGVGRLQRVVPIASLDSSVIFERQTTIGGRAFQQTLEPRLFYLYVPYRVQDPNKYPLFDTGAYDFTYQQLFAENRFVGDDRIANANQLTAAVSSRLYDGKGQERIQATIGQRFYFEPQRVSLTNNSSLDNSTESDIVALFSGPINNKVRLISNWQYDPRNGDTVIYNFGVNYQPAYAKALNLGYRFNRDVLEDVEVSGQWPLSRNWYGVGRVVNSLQDKKINEVIVGLEYKGGCWVFRSVIQRFRTTSDQFTDAFFVQLELNGLGGLGSSPLELLRRNVVGYGKINESAFTNKP